jgi:hypothetical protein
MRTSSNLRTWLPSTLPIVYRSCCIIRGKASVNLLFPGSKTSVASSEWKHITPKKSSDIACHVVSISFKGVLCSEGTQNHFFYNIFLRPISLVHTVGLCFWTDTAVVLKSGLRNLSLVVETFSWWTERYEEDLRIRWPYGTTLYWGDLQS